MAGSVFMKRVGVFLYFHLIALTIFSQASAVGLFPESLRRFDTKDNLAIQRKEIKVVTLVIGISEYVYSPLKNPTKDAAAVAEKFNRYGYDTTLLLNPNKNSIEKALQLFKSSSSNADAAIFYYAGHAIQVGGVNYIVPQDFSSQPDDYAAFESSLISMNEVIENSMASRIKLIILDACRNSPFSQDDHDSDGRNISSPLLRALKLRSGLAPISVSETSETLISFATKDGKVANDGLGDHSPFTEALLMHLDEKIDISLLLRRVRQEVMIKTKGEQQPWDYGSLLGEELIISK